MRNLTNAQLAELLDKDIFHKISQAADSLGLECYVVGGYVRDLFLERPSEDIDVVVVGSGISVATALKNILGKSAHLSVFRNFGTAQVKYRNMEVEFVGAIIWNIVTWWFGMPSSSSHALIGGMIGAVVISAGTAALNDWGIIKIVLSLILSPISRSVASRVIGSTSSAVSASSVR